MAREFQAFIGKLTTEETRDLLGEVIAILPNQYLFEGLDEALDDDQKAECVARWLIDNEG